MTDKQLLHYCTIENEELKERNDELKEQLEAQEKLTLNIQLVYMIIFALVVVGAVAWFG